MKLPFFTLIPLAAFSAYVGPPSSSAGVVERELEQEYGAEEIEPEKMIPSIEISVPKEEEGRAIPRAYIKEIDFCGNESISTDELQKMVQGYVECPLSFNGIQEICTLIKKKYREKGYFLARAYLPPQKLTGGRLLIGIVEGKLGRIYVEGNKHYSTKFIEGHFQRFQGHAIHYDKLMSALLLLNENPDLTVGLVLKKGEAVGTADIILRVFDEKPVHLYLDTNNYGSHQITVWRSGARLDGGNFLTSGDRISVAEVFGYPVGNLNFVDGRYSIPINYRGTRFEVDFLYSSFKVNALNPLHLRGLSLIGTGKISHAAVRKKRLNTDVTLSFDYKVIKNFALGEVNSADRLRVLGFDCHIDYIDSRAGRNWIDSALYLGLPDFLGGSRAIDPQSSRAGAGGRFFIYNFDLRRIQKIGEDKFIYLVFSGQLTPYKLPLAEQIYIGGVDTVRGYPLAVALGDNGYYLNVEYRFVPWWNKNRYSPWFDKKIKDAVQGIFFLDNGAVFLIGGKARGERRTALSSAGFGLRVHARWNLDLSLDVGFPITSHDKSSPATAYFRAAINI